MAADVLTRERLDRWELFGASWRVVHLSDTLAVVQLCTCSGEPVERLQSSDPDLISYLQSRSSSSETTDRE